ncbi:MAG: tyrosine--tRNA ligase [Candidatus Omnitrophota bacterium]|nr:tyrosine--tRNA ligase [Candidatus Omnitrophota bacterium]
MDISNQLKIIRRGVVEIISEEELRKKLEESAKNKRPLIIKAGFDPTAPDIHLGHTVLLRKMRQFQELGHQVVFLIGDFTGRIGDPSGRSAVRNQLSKKDVQKNAVTYKRQVSKVLDIRKLKIVFNGKWFDRMNGLEFGRLLTYYTATRLLERDDFSQRLKEKKPLYMSELIYPILQGYDSVVVGADIELGGTDQKFNLLVGRDLQKDFKQPQQVVLTMPLLEGTDGIQKMSKSLGNYIGINEPANEMFGKIMSISDALMNKYYELLTDTDLNEIKDMHPKEAKLRLAEEIISQYHPKKDAQNARLEFQRIFSRKELPSKMQEYKADATKTIINILTEAGLVKSGNEARRLIAQGAVYFNTLKIEKEDFILKESGILRIGSRRFLKVIV